MRINTVALILFWVTSFNIPYWSVAVAQSNLSIESSKHSCYYKYDKAGHLLSVEYALNSDKNEYYSYDVSGNITEKRIGNSIGSDIYVNEPHVSGGIPIISKTSEGVRCHEHDFLGTTLWSTDLKGNLAKNYSDTTIFGVGSIQKDVSARFTGKPYDSDLQAYVFPYRNYDASLARWRSLDPAGYPDGINQHFYAAVPTNSIDPLGCWVLIEYWSISKVFNYVDMGNAPFPGVEGVSDEGWRNTHAPAGNCGEVSIDGVFSGNNDASQQHIANTGPIPGGGIT